MSLSPQHQPFGGGFPKLPEEVKQRPTIQDHERHRYEEFLAVVLRVFSHGSELRLTPEDGLEWMACTFDVLGRRARKELEELRAAKEPQT